MQADGRFGQGLQDLAAGHGECLCVYIVHLEVWFQLLKCKSYAGGVKACFREHEGRQTPQVGAKHR